MIVYKCDKCGKIFDWYDVFYRDKKFNHMTYLERTNWMKDHPDAAYDESPRACMSWNCIHLRNIGPINDNMNTNNGVLTAKFEPGEGNNVLIMFCEDCMTDFVNSLCIDPEE